MSDTPANPVPSSGGPVGEPAIPFFVWKVPLPKAKIGTWDSELAEVFFEAFARIRRYYHTIEIVSGALLVIIGFLIFTNRFTIIAQWLTPYLPVY